MVCQEYVVAAMQCRRNDRPMKNCSLCPYALRVSRGYGCDVPRLCGDALELLREKTDTIMSLSGTIKKLTDAIAETAPRVMTLEEVEVFSVNDVVWLEDKGNQDVIPGIVRNRQLWPHSSAVVTNFTRGDRCTVTAGDADYGIRWRCWTSRPTDEQRKAEEWYESD